MRTLSELIGVILMVVAAFLGGIFTLAGMLLLILLALASGLLLGVSLFAAVGFAFTRNYHDGAIALVYLCYAMVPFVLSVLIHYCFDKWANSAPKPPPAKRQTVPDISRLQLACDATLRVR